MMMSNKNRVLFIQPDAAPYRTALYQHLAERYDITVAYVAPQDPKRRWILSPDARFREHRLGCLRISLGGKDVRMAFRGIFGLIKAAEVVVLCTNGPDTLSYILAGMISRLLGKRTICLVSINAEYRFVRASVPSSNSLNALLRWLCCLPLKLSDGGIGYCKSSEQLSRRLKLPCVSSSQYYPLREEYGPFTEQDVRDRIEARKNDSVIRVCILGYVSPRKGVKEALAALRDHKLLEGLSIEVVGSVDEESEYGKEVLSFEGENVTFCGNFNSQEKRALFQRVDAMLFPTFHDSWGHVVSEAMYFGVTVVASEHSMAARDLLKNSVNGFVYRDEAELMKAMMVVRARTMALDIGICARRDIENFNASSLEAWEAVLAGRLN